MDDRIIDLPTLTGFSSIVRLTTSKDYTLSIRKLEIIPSCTNTPDELLIITVKINKKS